MTTATALPKTAKPTETEYSNYCRWGIGPLGSFRQYWIRKEAQEIHRQRTGRADPWPSSEDYKQAGQVIPGGEA